MRAMRLQFSLATLLVCITVLAVVCAVCVAVHVREIVHGPTYYSGKPIYTWDEIERLPNAAEIVQRLAFWGPASLAVTLGVLWIGRRVLGRACPRAAILVIVRT